MKQFTRLFIFLALAAMSFSQTWICYGEPVYPIYNGKEYQVKGTVAIDENRKFYGDGSSLTGVNTDGNVIKVVKDGTGDFTTIQGAIDSITDSSASNRYVIKIYPGVYAEQVSLNENYVSLVGVSREQSRIVHTVSGEGYDKAIVRVSGSYGSIENLRIENTYNSGTDGKPAISIETQNVLIKDCDLITGGRDTVWIIDCAAADGNVILDRCYVEGDYDVLSAFRSFKVQNSYIKVNGSSQVIYTDTQATAKDITIYSLYNTIYQVGQKYVEEVGTGTNSIHVYSAFINTNQAFAATTSPYVTYYDYIVDPSMKIGTSFEVLGTAEISGTLTALSDIKAVDVKTNNLYAPQTNSYFSIYTGAVEGAGVYFFKTGGGDIMRWSPTTGKLEFDPGALESFDVNLYRGDANQLKTDDNFNCLALLTNGTTRISSAGVVTSTQTNTDNLRLD
ncbi:MAG: hypothetical protein KBA11_08300, partial [Sedimentibacter sp.]|nr:hypothetical protein [Sedimentibacter sp.]